MSKSLRGPDYLGHILEAIERMVWKTIHNDLPDLHAQIKSVQSDADPAS